MSPCPHGCLHESTVGNHIHTHLGTVELLDKFKSVVLQPRGSKIKTSMLKKIKNKGGGWLQSSKCERRLSDKLYLYEEREDILLSWMRDLEGRYLTLASPHIRCIPSNCIL